MPRESDMMKKKLSVSEKHQLNVARKTLNTPDAILGILGGMSKEEAKEVIYKLTGKRIKYELQD